MKNFEVVGYFKYANISDTVQFRLIRKKKL